MAKQDGMVLGIGHQTSEQAQYIESLKRRRNRDKSGRVINWTDNLSPEGQIAMRLAREDTRIIQKEKLGKDAESHPTPRSPAKVAFADENTSEEKVEPTREASFTELYVRNGSARMRRDITDAECGEDREPRKALDGGKVESALEIVEVVKKDEGPGDPAVLDEHAIEELARINSVDKCAVWIEATQGHQGEPETGEAGGEQSLDTAAQV